MARRNLFAASVAFLSLLIAAASVHAGTTYQYTPVSKGHAGGDLTPAEAFKMAKENPHAFIVDVRSRPEYVLIGHPTTAYHVPFLTWTGKHTSKEYGMAINQQFVQDLKARFNMETDTLIFMCRSGSRSCAAAETAVKAGWPSAKIFSMLGGFEGDKNGNSDSAFHGQRTMGGWRNEGLPWTYHVEKKLAYPEVAN